MASMSGTAELVGGYSTAVADLREASRGLWPGPSLSPQVLADAAAAVDGTDPEALVAQAQLAAGEHPDEPDAGGGYIEQLADVAEGAIYDALHVLSGDWRQHCEASRNLEHQAGECANAIYTIAQDSGETLLAMSEELQRLIAVLCAQLNTLDPEDHAAAFRGCIDAAGQLIDRSANIIMGVCQDRDEALGQCYDALLDFGGQVGEQPAAASSDWYRPVMSAVQIGAALTGMVQAMQENTVQEGAVQEEVAVQEGTAAAEEGWVPAADPKRPDPPAEPAAPEPPPPAPPVESQATVPAAESPSAGGASRSGGARKAGAW